MQAQPLAKTQKASIRAVQEQKSKCLLIYWRVQVFGIMPLDRRVIGVN